jgi:uncharacterized protein (UPF0210 family)
MNIKKIRLNVPTIEAVRLTEENIHEVAAWCGGEVQSYKNTRRIVIPLRGGIMGGEFFHPGCWLIRNPEMPGYISQVDSDELFKSTYTETETVTKAEIAEIILQTMTTPSRALRSLSFEAATRVFERFQQRAGKKIHCTYCAIDKNINEMAAKADGDPSTMCLDCQEKELARFKNNRGRD